MPRLAANRSTMYTAYALPDRFATAAADGFDAVKFLFPNAHAPAEIATPLQRHGPTEALFKLPPGDLTAGERGEAALPGRKTAFAEGVQSAVRHALATGCRRLYAMAGLGWARPWLTKED